MYCHLDEHSDGGAGGERYPPGFFTRFGRFLNLYGLIDWIGGGPLDGSWEVEVGLRYFLTPWLGINGGYIYSGLKIVIDDPAGFFRV